MTAVDTAGGTQGYEFSLTSFDADGFTISVANTWAAAVPMGYMALGGSDLLNAEVVEWTSPTTAINKAVTLAGSFKPNLVIHLTGWATAVGPGGSQLLNFGAMDAAGNQFSSCIYDVYNNNPTATFRAQRIDKCLVAMSGAGAINNMAHFVSMDTAGFTVNFDNSDGNARVIWSLAIQTTNASSAGVGTASKAITSATAIQSLLPPSGATITGAVFSTICSAATTTGIGGMRMALGFTDTTNYYSVMAQSANAVSTTACGGAFSTSKCLIVGDNDTRTVEAAASLTTAGAVPQSPLVTGHQGIAFDGTYYYGVDTTGIYKYDINWNLITQNTSAASNAGVDHLGDGDYYNGLLYVAGENFTSCATFSNQRIAIFNASDLSYVTYHDISAQGAEIAGCAVDADDGVIWTACYCDGVLRKYNLSTFAYISSITPSPAISNVQGVAYYNSNLYVSMNAPGSDQSGYVVKMSMTGGTQSTVVPYIGGYGFIETEGITVNADRILLEVYVIKNIYKSMYCSFPQSGTFPKLSWTTNNSTATEFGYIFFGADYRTIYETTVPGTTSAAGAATPKVSPATMAVPGGTAGPGAVATQIAKAMTVPGGGAAPGAVTVLISPATMPCPGGAADDGAVTPQVSKAMPVPGGVADDGAVAIQVLPWEVMPCPGGVADDGAVTPSIAKAMTVPGGAADAGIVSVYVGIVLTPAVVSSEMNVLDPTLHIDALVTTVVINSEVYAIEPSDIIIWVPPTDAEVVSDLTVDEATDKTIYGFAKYADGEPYNLATATIEWNMRDHNGDILALKSTADGSIIIDVPELGMFHFKLSHGETDWDLEPTIKNPIVARHEARIIDGDKQFVGLRGRVFIMPSQTEGS
jgi:hypothetical protein